MNLLRSALFASAAVLALFAVGCDVDPYCISCGNRDGGPPDTGVSDTGSFDTGPEIDAGVEDSGPPDSGPDGCVPGSFERCNTFDDDCDGNIDEDVDTTSDPTNCGGCGMRCVASHALASCVDSRCEFVCDVGFYDIDMDLGSTPTNGCEYRCLPTEADDVICDLRDNDCDGTVDEDVDFDNDPRNCGSCGNACRFAHAAGTCVMGACALGTCDAGFYDDDLDPSNGCEYACMPRDPPTEICNGLDDDCNGDRDEMDPGGGGSCGTDAGECAIGVERCMGGLVVCTGGVSPTTELCNGLDDDCDGVTDQGNPEGGRICGSSTGTCENGREVCTAGALVCTGAVGPEVEECDGLDNDCDGTIDEGNPGGGGTCGDDTGECTFGALACRGGVIVCEGGTSPGLETCNTRDDDCDGTIDEGNPEGGARCGSDVGACVPGTQQCTAGALVCVGAVGATPETCNSVDDDCDGTVDEGDPGGGASCGSDTGECTAGVMRCRGGTVSCVGAVGPTAETCDGRDNDCDAMTDEGNPGGGAACGSSIGTCRPGALTCSGGVLTCMGGTGPGTETCNSLDDDCDGVVDDGIASPGNCGTDVGECDFGRQQCMGGTFVCVGGRGPATERCNARDDDCDGMTDEMNPDGGAACGTATGECNPGTEMCVTGTLQCVGAIGPVAETCNNRDDDCDGRIDQGNPGGGGTCGMDTGECSFGSRVCTGGTLVCMGGTGPATETCNGLDDDCDGMVDDGNPGGGAACGTNTGECTAGAITCTGGALVCTGSVGPVAEICNGLDDDCDAMSDEGNPGGGGLCGTDTGECSPGTRQCTGGMLVCTGATGPRTETCNALDDDCDAMVDEGNPGGGASCGTDVGDCVAGRQTCLGGTLVCTGSTGPATEVCDTRDNDCDGMTDEGFMLSSDPRNCGMCGRVCTFPNATAVCSASVCTLGMCNPGFFNRDGNPANGCEYACSFAGAEVCNGRDDDCDGLTDEGLTPPAMFCNPNGVCAGTTATCSGAGGWVCNYPATFQPTEARCDGLDNDCDGMIDEPFPTRGTSCANGVGACRRTGIFVCNMAGDGVTCNAPPAGTPADEACDNVDNDCDTLVDEVQVNDPGTAWRDGIDVTAISTVVVNKATGGTMRVMQYEASRPDATATAAGSASTLACSRANVIPWTNVTVGEAQAACCRLNVGGACPAPGAAGWQLCGAEDWEEACQGPAGTCEWSYQTMCTTSQRLVCNGDEYDSDPGLSGNQDALFTTGSATFPQCNTDWAAAGRVFDLSGNVREWTNTQAAPGQYQVRGGAYTTIEAGRACDFDFVVADTTFRFENTGFRCCLY